jgi:acylpyruvate hydrolase
VKRATVLHDGRELAVTIEGDEAIPEGGPPIPLAEVTYLPVVPRPGKVICVGLNYAAHIEETQREHSDYPVLFPKFATSLCGAFDDIPVPPESQAVDYEGELVVVIGTPARRVSEADAMQHVAGYSVANDVTMRDYQAKTHQWMQGKAWDRSTPVGPWMVTADEVPDPKALTLRTIVNGATLQETTTDLMIFDIPVLVSTISEFATLEPGDLILTGTPAGVGFRREPPVLLGDGDVVAVEIDGVGRIENRFFAESV